MKTPVLILLILIAGIFQSGCHTKKDSEEQQLSWSTESPLSIPYRTRFQRLEKKNLLRNHSFETGRTFKLDSIKKSFVMDGWLQVGPHVEWVDTRQDSLFARDEVLSGYRAVKITRKQAYETDQQGEGVLSDFIKVIPGNYSLSFFTRLENVRPVKERLGIKMNDAVDVRLLYFDKSKIAIGPEHPFPQANQVIDNSFKSLSLANFSVIPSFGWGKIIGKSAEFPFPDGDIPSNAHYVKIFIGLKGLGTMWIDSVDFSYTRRNFSVEERMQSFTDTTYTVQPFVIPTPKKLQRTESVIFSDKPERLPMIVIPEKADPLILYAAVMLQNALADRATAADIKNSGFHGIPIIKAGSEKILPDEKLTFILGTTSLFEEHRKGFPMAEIQDHPQGYYLYSPVDMPHTVFLNGNNSLGVYYAVLTAVQLIDSRQPVYHNAQVVDYPDFENRFYTLDKITNPDAVDQNVTFARELETFKINGAFYRISERLELDPGGPLAKFRQLMTGSGYYRVACISSGDLADPGNFFSTRIYAPDMIIPDDSSLCYPSPADFCGIENITGIARKLAGDLANKTGFSFLLLPAFNNQMLDYFNYTGMLCSHIPGFTHVYSGSSFFGMRTDDADFKRFMAYAKGKPVFMDNSMLTSSSWGHFGGAYPYYSGKIRLYNIFEPFVNTDIRDHIHQLDSSLYWVNLIPASEIDVIRLATAADFMWNAGSYDPDYSLWKVLLSRYGVEASRELVRYADLFGLMLEIELKLTKNEPISRNLKNVQDDLSNLSMVSGRLEQLLGLNHPLMKDIHSLNALLNDRLEKFIHGTPVNR
jgi:hypothetical protein